MRALLDTSFFVATERGRPLRDMPGVTETEVSVVTVAELTIGVLVAGDADRSARLSTLAMVESTWDPLPVDAAAARAFARIAADLRSRRMRVPILDALVAATAVAAHIPVVTQDRDFHAIPDVEVISV